MVGLEELSEKYRTEGYSERNADARLCQDIVLKAIEKSELGRNVTIKGGVVMRSITGNVRRATVDLDLDFIRYSLEDDSIRKFISKLNCLEGIHIEIKNDKIVLLSQQEYRGKRIFVIISDDTGYSIESKIDLGVHADMTIEQEEYCFDVCMDDEGASLLINSCEQIFAEKLRSLCRFGAFSSRYKDIYDFCYLKDHVDMEKLRRYISTYIIEDPEMRETDMDAIRKRVSITFKNRQFREKMAQSERLQGTNWLQIEQTEAMRMVEEFLGTI